MPLLTWFQRQTHWSQVTGFLWQGFGSRRGATGVAFVRSYWKFPLWPRGELTLEQPVPEGLHTVEGTHTGAVHEELQPLGRTHVGEDCGGLFPAGVTPCWSKGRM